MSENPYDAPRETSEQTATDETAREELRSIATEQRRVILCILVYMFAFIGQFFLPIELAQIVGPLALLFVGIVGAVFVFRLAIKLYGIVVGVLVGVLTLVPFLGFLLLLLVNQRATSKLQLAGVKVGFLGANPDQI